MYGSLRWLAMTYSRRIFVLTANNEADSTKKRMRFGSLVVVVVVRLLSPDGSSSQSSTAET